MDWKEKAFCRGVATDLFYLPDNLRGVSKKKRVAAAKALCARCTVLKNCRDESIASRETYGVWGGMTPEERETVWMTLKNQQ